MTLPPNAPRSRQSGARLKPRPAPVQMGNCQQGSRQRARERLQTDSADLLAWQLEHCSPLRAFQREFHAIPGRRFRIDIAFPAASPPLAVEVDGAIWTGGRHVRGAGVTADCTKSALLAIQGWRLMRVTTEQVKSGLALAWIQQAIL